jgi:hypothetical protein
MKTHGGTNSLDGSEGHMGKSNSFWGLIDNFREKKGTQGSYRFLEVHTGDSLYNQTLYV